MAHRRGTNFTHGESGYVNYRCRCEVCTEAQRLAVRYDRARRRAARELVDGRLVATAPGVVHGSATYTNHACRCETCCQAHREARARSRRMGA